MTLVFSFANRCAICYTLDDAKVHGKLYYQECSRAGRDHNISHCILYYRYNDSYYIRQMVEIIILYLFLFLFGLQV
jgi:hypothetical protein